MLKKFFVAAGAIIALPILLVVLFSDSHPPRVQTPAQDAQQTLTEATTSNDTGKPIAGGSRAAETNVAPQSTPASATSSPQSIYYSVAGIVDGDTIKVTMNGREETLRLIGMDTPETVDPRKPVQNY